MRFTALKIGGCQTIRLIAASEMKFSPLRITPLKGATSVVEVGMKALNKSFRLLASTNAN